MLNEQNKIRLNGISFPAGSEKFREKFFEYTGWEFGDLERVTRLQNKQPVYVAHLEQPLKALWGIIPGQNEKTVRKAMGTPRIAHYDRFWKPEVSFLIYDAKVGPVRFKLHLIFMYDKLHFIMMEPRTPAFTDTQIFDFLKGYMGESRFFCDVLPAGRTENYQVLRDTNGNAFLMEHFFTLRFYFLSADICPAVPQISVRVSA